MEHIDDEAHGTTETIQHKYGYSKELINLDGKLKYII